jgi:type IV pilus assembly protein PilC
MGSPSSLPLPTQITLELGKMLRDPYVLAALLVTAGAACALFRVLRQSRRVRYWVQRLLLRLPVAGPYLRTVVLARFCRLLSILLGRRIPMTAALTMVRDSFAFVPAQEAVERVRQQVANGEGLAQAIEQCRFFPATLAGFVRGAERHGELPQSLSRLAELYDQRADVLGSHVRFTIYLVAQLMIGACVFFMLVSVFLPIFKMQEVMRKK